MRPEKGTYMAFLEDIGKTIGQVAGGVSGAAQTVAGSAQETMEQIRQRRQQEQAPGAEGKCPGCGQPLNGLEAVCPMCGHEFLATEEEGSVAEFAKKLAKLESGRRGVMESMSKAFSGRTSYPTDEKIAGLIRSYVIPSTKQDVFDFMLLASGNMDAQAIAKLDKRKGLFGSSNALAQESDGISEVVLTAWLNKFEQAYQKAKISFGDDPDFRQIQELYDKKMGEIETARTKRRKW
jgi:uncharacterized Zn finger protein (UPF0148 family)